MNTPLISVFKDSYSIVGAWATTMGILVYVPHLGELYINFCLNFGLSFS